MTHSTPCKALTWDTQQLRLNGQWDTCTNEWATRVFICECVGVRKSQKTEAGGRLGRGAREDNQTQRKTDRNGGSGQGQTTAAPIFFPPSSLYFWVFAIPDPGIPNPSCIPTLQTLHPIPALSAIILCHCPRSPGVQINQLKVQL